MQNEHIIFLIYKFSRMKFLVSFFLSLTKMTQPPITTITKKIPPPGTPGPSTPLFIPVKQPHFPSQKSDSQIPLTQLQKTPLPNPQFDSDGLSPPTRHTMDVLYSQLNGDFRKVREMVDTLQIQLHEQSQQMQLLLHLPNNAY